jgi:hypothetical protein
MTFVKCLKWKHCSISCPPNATVLYFNHTNFPSINLLGAADANGCFTLINVEAYGSGNNSSVFSSSSSGDLKRSSNEKHSTYKHKYPIVHSRGSSFPPPKPKLMRPFHRWEVSFTNTTFSGQLSCTRQTVQCTFGFWLKSLVFFKRLLKPVWKRQSIQSNMGV